MRKKLSGFLNLKENYVQTADSRGIKRAGRNKGASLLAVFLTAITLGISGCGLDMDSMAQAERPQESAEDVRQTEEQAEFQAERNKTFGGMPQTITSDDIPSYSGEAYVVINNNIPLFTEDDYTTDSFESYSELDGLGRCGAAYANIGQDLMPTGEKSSIGQVKPTGWHTVTYDVVNGSYLYNRCHLIGYQLTAENANERNLITGTRYLNVVGMLPFENRVAEYIKETNHHVLYRVTPVFEGDNLLADGVLMEAWSVEDNGEGICFYIFAYNVQPGVEIDYATGDSCLEEGSAVSDADGSSTEEEYILNTNTMKFHDPSCSSVERIAEENKTVYVGNREELTDMGYEPCKACRP